MPNIADSWGWSLGPYKQRDHSPVDTINNGDLYRSNWIGALYNLLGTILSVHDGDDIVRMGANIYGENIYAMANGIVTYAHDVVGTTWRLLCVIQHTLPDGSHIYTRMAHLKDLLVQAGDTVTKGQLIGHVGDAFGALAPHLHLNISNTEILLNNPTFWASAGHTADQATALIFANFVDPLQFVKDRMKQQMTELHNALLVNASSLIPVMDTGGMPTRFLPGGDSIVVDYDPANILKVGNISLYPLLGGGYVYERDAVVGTLYVPAAPSTVEKVCTADALVVRSGPSHTSADTLVRVHNGATVSIVNDNGTPSTDGAHSYVYFKLADGSGYVAGVIDGVSYLADPTPAHAANILHGFDSSHYNTWQANPDLSQVDFVILKGAQGMSADDTYAPRYALVEAADKPVITTLFPNAPTVGASMVQQADAQLAILKAGGIDIDYENNLDGTIPSIAQLIEYLNAILAATGLTKLLLYTRADLLPDNPPPELTRHDLWLPGDPAKLVIPHGWTPSQVKFIQYAQGNVPGVGGPLDLDQFVGSQDDLLTYIDSITPKTISTTTPPAGRILGVNLDLRNPSGTPIVSKLAGVSWVRMVLKCNYEQGNTVIKASIADTLAFYDPIVRSYAAAGIRVLVVLNHETFASGCPIWDQSGTWPNFATSFAAVAMQVASHFKGVVSAYEIWNEPDDPNGAPVPPVGYGTLFRATTVSIRLPDPFAKIITAGLQSADPVAYLKACGDIGKPDGYGLHPYLHEGAALASIVNEVAALGPVWLTEYGVSLEDYALAANTLTQAYDTVATISSVRMICWYAWSTAMNLKMSCIVDESGRPNGQLYTAWQQLISQDNPVQGSPLPPSAVTPPPTPVTPPAPPPVVAGAYRDLAGLGVYDPENISGFGPLVVETAKECFDAGHPFNSILIMNDIATANALVPYVKHVLFRWYAYDSKWAIDDGWTSDQVIKYANDLWTGWDFIRQQLDVKVIILPVCEKNSKPWSGLFMLTWMQRDVAEGKGRVSGIFGDSPDEPADFSEMANRIDAMRYAAQHDFYYIDHAYGDPATPGYYRVLYEGDGKGYAGLPTDARPRVIETESTYADGLYRDPAQTVAYLDTRETTHQDDPYLEGFCLWMLGMSFQNPKFVANAALNAIKAWRLSK